MVAVGEVVVKDIAGRIVDFDSMAVVRFQRRVVVEEDMVVGSSSVPAAS